MTYAGITTAGASALTKIETQTVPSSQSSITFSAIPGTYVNLIVEMAAVTTTTGPRTWVTMYLNGAAGANAYSYMGCEMPTASGGSGNFYNSTGDTTMKIAGANPHTTMPAWVRIVLPLYSGAFTKMAVAESGYYNAGAGQQMRLKASGYWNSTAAVTSILLMLSTGTYATGTVATLWGQS